MATKGARGRVTLTELKKTQVDERGAEHIAPGVRAKTTRTRHYAFLSDGAVIQRDSYKVEYSGVPAGRYCPDTSDSGTWRTVIRPTNTSRKVSPTTAELIALQAKHQPRIDELLAKGFEPTRTKGR